MESYYEELKPFFEEIKKKIERNEIEEFKLSREIINFLKERIEEKNNESIWQYIIEGLAFLEKIKKEEKIYENDKNLALNDLRIGKEIQQNIKREMGNLIVKGFGKIAKEVQEFNYKLFEGMGFLRKYEDKIEEIEIRLEKEKEREKELEKERKKIYAIKDAISKVKIKKVEKRKKKLSGKFFVFIILVFLILAGVHFLTLKKSPPIKFEFKISDFPQIPEDSEIKRGSYNLDIKIPKEWWDKLPKTEKRKIISEISGKMEEKGYLMLNIYSKDGKKLARWIKGERILIFEE